MNQRERLLAVFSGEKPDITPWYADLIYWYESHKTMQKLPKEYEGEEGYLKLHQDTGAGIYLYPPSVWKEEFGESIKTSVKKEGNKTLSTICTPLGELSSIKEYLPQSFSTAYKEYYIKKPEDLRIMRYIFSHRKITHCFDDFRRIDALWGGYGLPDLLAPICVSPLQTLLSRWAGVQTTIFLLIDSKEEMERTITELEKDDDEIFQIIADSPAKLVEFPDNLSGEVTGENLIEKYNLPYWQKRIEQLHKAGKFVGIHNDGTLKGSLSSIIKAGFDFAEAVTPTPVGDLTLEEIKKIADDKIIIWGCLPGALFSRVYSEDYFVNYLKKVIQTFPLGSKFVLGVADQVPPDTDFLRICLVREILENQFKSDNK
ncbi:MAG: hypothetical protein Q7J67_04230 [bacterium]|nr:hypothetical protein [bacterium]